MPPPDIDALSLSELKSLMLKLLEERAEFQRTVGALRDEIARLKGGPGRPGIKANVKPSGMKKAIEARAADPSSERRRRGVTGTKLTIHEEHKLEVAPPLGSRFKGYAGFLVQDLIIRPHVTHFRRACWRTPDGRNVMAWALSRQLVVAAARADPYPISRADCGRTPPLFHGFGAE
jgi:hypothetical protein